MKRLTVTDAGGACRPAEGAGMDEIVGRLAKFEQLRDALEQELEKTAGELEKLRAQGRQKTVTYRQLLAGKLELMNLIGRFEFYGL